MQTAVSTSQSRERLLQSHSAQGSAISPEGLAWPRTHSWHELPVYSGGQLHSSVGKEVFRRTKSAVGEVPSGTLVCSWMLWTYTNSMKSCSGMIIAHTLVGNMKESLYIENSAETCRCIYIIQILKVLVVQYRFPAEIDMESYFSELS